MKSQSNDDDTLRTASAATEHLADLAWSASSSVGLRRSDNQDYWGARAGRRFVVADGVGGSLGGATASASAVTAFLDLEPDPDWHRALTDVNQTVLHECTAKSVPDAATTLVACQVAESRAVVVHVGDSRAYHLTSSALRRLTVDHNLGEHLKAQGRTSAAGGTTSLRALVSYIGADENDLQVGVCEVTLAPGDRLLLCTDGVHEQLEEERLTELLTSVDIAGVAQRIVDAADHAGGRDNATALVMQRS